EACMLAEDFEVRMAADIEAAGYAVVENAIDAAILGRLRERLDSQAAGELAQGQVFSDIGDNRRVFNLINKGRVFRDLALHPVGLAAARLLLGKDFLLSSMTANIVQTPGVAQYVHRDQTADFRCAV